MYLTKLVAARLPLTKRGVKVVFSQQKKMIPQNTTLKTLLHTFTNLLLAMEVGKFHHVENKM